MGAKQVGGCTAMRLSCYDSADLYFFGKTGVPVCRPGIGGIGLSPLQTDVHKYIR